MEEAKAVTRGSGRPVVEFAPGLAEFLLPESIRQLLPGPLAERPNDPAQSPRADRLEITWNRPTAGRLPLPLRPAATDRLAVFEACRHRGNRPAPWCLIATASETSAELLYRLTESWGPGIASLARRASAETSASRARCDSSTVAPGVDCQSAGTFRSEGVAETDHGTPRDEAACIQRHSQIRTWWGPAERLDPFLVLESLRHGCLPLQWVPPSSYHNLRDQLPEGLAELIQPFPARGVLPPVDEGLVDQRLDAALSALLNGCFDRDLARNLSELQECSHGGS